MPENGLTGRVGASLGFIFTLFLIFLCKFLFPKLFSVLFSISPLPGAQLWLYRSVPLPPPREIFIYLFMCRETTMAMIIIMMMNNNNKISLVVYFLPFT